MVDLKSFGKFFTEEKQSQKHVKVTIVLEKSLKLESLPKHLITINTIENQDVLSKGYATHVVVGAQYGKRAIVSLVLKLNENQDKLITLEELRNLAVSVVNDSSNNTELFTTKDKEMMKNVIWTVHGDLKTFETHLSYEEVKMLILQFYQDECEDTSTTYIWVMPLTDIIAMDSKSLDISSNLIEKCIKQLDSVAEVKLKVNDLCCLPCLQVFQNTKTELEKFIQLLDTSITLYKFQIKQCLCNIKRGIISEDCLSKIIMDRNASPFAQHLLENWSQKANDFSNFLSNVFNTLNVEPKNILVCKTKDEIKSRLKPITFVLIIKYLLSEDLLNQMKTLSKSSNLKSSESLLYKNIFTEAILITKSFKEFAMENSGNEESVFFAIEELTQCANAEELIPVSVRMFRNGREEPCPTIPSKPENVIIKEVSNEMVSISWEKPQKGSDNILGYFLTATEASVPETKEFSIPGSRDDTNHFMLENLSCGSTYRIALKGSTDFGFSPAYHMQITTLVAGPPVNLRASFIQRKGFLVKWNQPEVMLFDVNKIQYIVRLDVQNKASDSIDHLKEGIANNGEGFKLLQELYLEKIYIITVTTVTDKGKGYFSRVTISMQQDSDHLNLGFQKNKAALNSKLSSSTNLDSAQLIPILQKLLVSKNDVEFVLEEQSKILKEFSEIKEVLKQTNLLSASSSKTAQELISDLLSKNQSHKYNLQELYVQIKMLLAALEVSGKTPLSIAVEAILYYYGYVNEKTGFNSCLNCAQIDLLIKQLYFIISKVQSANDICNNVEIEVLFGFLEIEKSPKKFFEFYILTKVAISPTRTLLRLKNYLKDWKDDEIRGVLETLRRDEVLEKVFNSSIMNNKKSNDSLKNSNLLKATDSSSLSTSDAFRTRKERKLCREDVFSVDLNQSELANNTDTEKHLTFLKQLMSLDYHCRNQESTKKSENTNETYYDCEDEDEFFSNPLKKKKKKIAEPKKLEKEVSNADLVQKAVSICDDFLLQDVYDKMSSCQLAVPIVSLREKKLLFHLWATRAIKKKWVKCVPDQEGQVHDQFITNQQMGTISFCRMGNINVSKSKLANLLLSSVQGWPDHSYFLYRDIDSKSYLNRGCIESCWYCPVGKQKEHLKDIHCIYNLRGDTRENKSQFQFLLDVSSTVVVLMNSELQKNEIELLKSTDSSIILINLSQDNKPKTMGNKVFLFALNMNHKELSETVLKHIPICSQKLLNIEEHAKCAFSLGMEIDEKNESCQLGKKAADEFVKKLKLYDTDSLKHNVVPLQGSVWQQWGKHDKEESRHQFIGDQNPQKYSSYLRDKKKRLRHKQFNLGKSDEINFFIKQLRNFRNTITQRYFITWCQINLNEESERYLPIILRDYNNSRKKLSKLVKQLESVIKNDNSDLEKARIQSLIDQEKNNTIRLSEHFSIASFGIEHIFREFSQIYESHEFKGEQKSVSFLPKLMADLFIMGYPFEIMDGDASHIPLTWLKKVFSEVKKILRRDINVFVLSILGIQSSGKSTLLNTMFGSKFAVSSGRCTKGVFIQLLPVSSNLRQKMNCDYFIIMDSEGLRSPEQSDSFRHDNEIATLVACLANTTIINFLGQTFSKEMSDIMQIAAHACIRMKEVKIKSFFHMIFAQVQDVTAEERNRLGVGNILDKLNTMILKIARDEGKTNIFSGVSSIFPLIQEHLDQLVFPEFLPALWHGNMNPPESEYGEIVQKLKNSICFGLMRNQGQGLKSQPLTEFVNRLSDVWEAIKQENFIFGFKNSQAVEVYGELQLLYDRELAQMRKKFFEVSYQLAEECLRDELTDEAEGFRKYSNKVDQVILPQVDIWQDRVVEQLRAHIFEMTDPEMAAAHLSTFSFDMKKKVVLWLEKEKMVTKEKIVAICRKEKTAPMKREQFKKKCLLKAREVAGELKASRGNVSLASIVIEEDLFKRYFEDIFNVWIQEAHAEDNESIKSLTNILPHIWEDSLNLLFEKLNLLHPRSDAELHSLIDKNFIDIHNEKDEHISLFNIEYEKEDLISKQFLVVKWVKNLSKNECGEPMNKAKEKTNAIFKKTQDIISECKRKSTSHFSYVPIIAEILHSASESLLSPIDSSVEFSKIFKINFLIKIFGYSVKKIAALYKEQIQKNFISSYLQSKKAEMYKEFEIECQTADNDARAGTRFISSILCPIITEQVKLTIGSTVFDAMISKNMFSQKNIMMFYLLKDLLNAPFSQVQSYIQDYKSYVKSWIKERVNNVFNFIFLK